MIRSTLAAAAAALTLSTPMAHAVGGSFICENQMDMDQEEAREISGSNNGLYQILMTHREHWDIAHMRAQCEAYADGRPYEISCLDDRRDWDAIKSSVPEEYFGMSSEQLTPRFHEIQATFEEWRDVVGYCRSVGAIE